MARRERGRGVTKKQFPCVGRWTCFGALSCRKHSANTLFGEVALSQVCWGERHCGNLWEQESIEL